MANLRLAKIPRLFTRPCYRGYKNLWGHQNSSDEVAPINSVANKSRELRAESWRLDWEEDHRWVEWRLDQEFQAEGEKHRVQKEWVRFREDRGRKWSRLWDENSGGFDRGTEQWWRRQHYNHEFVGKNSVASMHAVNSALKTLEVSDSGDASAIRGAYLRLVNRWHPDRFQIEAERKLAAEKFRQVTDAYNLLREYRQEG